jgi:hypothetical protein
MIDEDWVCIIHDPQPGTVTVTMYETGDTPSAERRSIRVELNISQMTIGLEALQRALNYHLRMMS